MPKRRHPDQRSGSEHIEQAEPFGRFQLAVTNSLHAFTAHHYRASAGSQSNWPIMVNTIEPPASDRLSTAICEETANVQNHATAFRPREEPQLHFAPLPCGLRSSQRRTSSAAAGRG